MSGSISRKGKGLTALASELRRVTSAVVRIGVPTKDDAEGVSLSLIGAANEFGTANIPARPFLRPGVKNVNEYKTKLAAITKRYANGQFDTYQTLDSLGLIASQAVKSYVTETNFTANAPSTIKRKGSSKPLIDTGRLRNSITWQVTPK